MIALFHLSYLSSPSPFFLNGRLSFLHPIFLCYVDSLCCLQLNAHFGDSLVQRSYLSLDVLIEFLIILSKIVYSKRIGVEIVIACLNAYDDSKYISYGFAYSDHQKSMIIISDQSIKQSTIASLLVWLCWCGQIQLLLKSPAAF